MVGGADRDAASTASVFTMAKAVGMSGVGPIISHHEAEVAIFIDGDGSGQLKGKVVIVGVSTIQIEGLGMEGSDCRVDVVVASVSGGRVSGSGIPLCLRSFKDAEGEGIVCVSLIGAFLDGESGDLKGVSKSIREGENLPSCMISIGIFIKESGIGSSGG